VKSHSSLLFYFILLELPIALGPIGVIVAIYREIVSRPKPRVYALAVAAAALIETVLVAWQWFSFSGDVQRVSFRLYKSPISSFNRIRICPASYFSLVEHEVDITNTTTISAIVKAIRAATPYSPQHPNVRWSCYLVISSSSGECYLDVDDTEGLQFTILDCTTSFNSGLIYDTLRSDSLAGILEKVVGRNPDKADNIRTRL
jgi:hypothetical protein